MWKVEDGAIVAEHWPERRVGTTYIMWRGGEPSDFELKLEVKADYDVHGGIYRSIVGPASVTASAPAASRRPPTRSPAAVCVVRLVRRDLGLSRVTHDPVKRARSVMTALGCPPSLVTEIVRTSYGEISP